MFFRTGLEIVINECDLNSRSRLLQFGTLHYAIIERIYPGACSNDDFVTSLRPSLTLNEIQKIGNKIYEIFFQRHNEQALQCYNVLIKYVGYVCI